MQVIIWKFAFPREELTQSVEVQVPFRSRFLSVVNQNDYLTFYYETPVGEDRTVTNHFALLWTGQPFSIPHGSRFVATLQFGPTASPLMLHVYEV